MEIIDIDKMITAGDTKQVKSVPILTDQLVVATYILEANKRLPAHKHDHHDEINYIVRGKGNIFIEKEKHNVHSGMLILIPRNKSHFLAAEDDELVVLTFNQINGTCGKATQ